MTGTILTVISNDELSIIKEGLSQAANDAEYHYTCPEKVGKAIKTIALVMDRFEEASE